MRHNKTKNKKPSGHQAITCTGSPESIQARIEEAACLQLRACSARPLNLVSPHIWASAEVHSGIPLQAGILLSGSKSPQKLPWRALWRLLTLRPPAVFWRVRKPVFLAYFLLLFRILTFIAFYS